MAAVSRPISSRWEASLLSNSSTDVTASRLAASVGWFATPFDVLSLDPGYAYKWGTIGTIADELLWTAAPGEWYRVLHLEGGWALALWEEDSPEWAVWIAVDERVLEHTQFGFGCLSGSQ